jgi:hypothetical protein
MEPCGSAVSRPASAAPSTDERWAVNPLTIPTKMKSNQQEERPAPPPRAAAPRRTGVIRQPCMGGLLVTLGALRRACAGRWSGAAARTAFPAVAGPGPAEQPATDDGGVGQRQPERHYQRATLGAPAQLAVPVAPGVGALHRPASARVDRGWHPAWRSRRACRAWPAPAGRAGSYGRRPDARPAGRAAHRPRPGRPGSRQQPIVTTVGRSCHHAQRDALSLAHRGALQPLKLTRSVDTLVSMVSCPLLEVGVVGSGGG